MADDVLLNVGSGGDTIGADEIGGVKFQRNKLIFGADGVNDGDVATDNPFPTREPNIISTDNSTIIPLGIAGVFTGISEDVSQCATVAVLIHSSHDSAVDGMVFQFSINGSDWDQVHTFTYTSVNGGRNFQFPVTAQFFRIVYTNGGTAQTTFRVETLLHTKAINTSIHRLVDAVDPDRSATLVKSAIVAQAAGTGNFVPVQTTAAGNLKVGVEELNGVAPSLDTGIRDAGTQRVTVATDDLVPISAASLPLPAGAATAAGQLVDGHAVTVDNAAAGAAVNIQDGGNSLTVDAPVATPVNTQISDGTETALVSVAGALHTDGSAVTQPISAASLPLPTGAATNAAQLPDGHAVTIDNGAAGAAVNVQDGGNSLTVDAPTGTPVNVQIGDGTDQVSVTPSGDLNVAVANGPPGPGTYDTFGHLVTGQLNNQVDVQFFRDTPQNLVTVSTTGSGAAVSNLGGALFSSGVDTTASSKGVSNTNTIYRSGAEVYVVLTASFVAGVASSYERIGLYDTNDGFFLGYEGTSFGVTTRNNASDATITKASFSDDDLTGGASSLFTRDGTPEAIDLTKLNVYRIRFGWLGSAPTCFEVMAPDGHWVIFHRTLYPNLQTNPSIRNADLPITLDISKTTAGATDLQIQTDCWGAGVTTNHQRLDDVLTDASLADTQRSVITAFNGTSFVNIQSTAAGNLKMSVQEVSDGLDVGAGNAGTETQRVSISTDDINLAAINAGQLPDGHNVTVDNAAGASAINVQDGGNSLTVDNGGTFAVQNDAATPAGTNLIGDVGISVRTSGGTTLYKNIDVDESEDAVKATAGQIYWIHAMNLTGSVLYLKFYDDTVASVIVGTTVPDLTFPIPTQGDTNGAGFVLSIPNGIAFGTAITIAATTGIADNDAGPPGANAVVVNLGFA